MKARRGSSLWPETDGLSSMIYRFEPGDIVTAVTSQQPQFIGVVREVLPKINKVMVLWNGGSLKQHDPDEIMLSPHQDPIVRTRMAATRRFKSAFLAEESPVPHGENFVGDPEMHGIDKPRGGGFSIMQDLQKDLHKEQKKESEAGPKIAGARRGTDFFVAEGGVTDDASLKSITGREVTKEEWEHALAVDEAMLEKVQRDLATLEKGGEIDSHMTVESAKQEIRGLKEVIKNKKVLLTRMASLKSRRAMYWGAPERIYRLTKEEQENGSAVCPRCKKQMALEPFTKSEKLYTCQKCGFKVPTSKTTNTRITIDVDKGTGEVDVDVTTAQGKGRRGSL